MKSHFEIQMNLEGEIEITQKTVMTQMEFLSLSMQVHETARGNHHDRVTDVLPPSDKADE